LNSSQSVRISDGKESSVDSVYSSRRRWLFFAGVLAILGSVVAWPLIPDDRDSPGNDAIIVWTSFGCGAVTPDGKELIPFDYQEIRKFNSLRIAVARRIGDGHLGCIDFLGNTLVPFEWDEIYEFNDAGQAWAVRGNESNESESGSRQNRHFAS
jgi:hypothetical protein